MYVMTVVPKPDRVMRELERVCAAGGEVILVNHFSQDEGVRGFIERRLAPFAEYIGWRPVFGLDQVLVCDDLRLAESRSLLRPLGLFTMLRFVKEPGFGLAPQLAARSLKRALRRACRSAPGCRSRSGLGSNGRSPARWCIAGVCLTPIIGDPYIGGYKANWRSNIRPIVNWRSSSAG